MIGVELKFEVSFIPESKFNCEPNLGKRNLYPTLSSKSKYHSVKNMMNIIAYCDGQHSVKDLSKKLRISKLEVKNTLKKLIQKKVIIQI